MDYHSIEKEDIFEGLDSSKEGLTSEDAKSRLEKYGKNIIKKTHNIRPLKILLGQFTSFLIYILIIAAILSFFIGNLIDGSVITAIIIINASIGFFQQYKAEKAIESLRKLLIPISIVIRDGQRKEISSYEIVPGDILVLNSGDKINADCRIFESQKLQTNEAVLTGESLPTHKNDLIIKENTPLANRSNMLYTGTQVVRGNCLAIVVATGSETEFGKIASQLQKIKIQKTPMQKQNK